MRLVRVMVLLTVKKNVVVSKVCCSLCTKYYCELVTNVVYNNFQDTLVPLGAIQCSREYKKFLRASLYISTVHSCN